MLFQLHRSVDGVLSFPYASQNVEELWGVSAQALATGGEVALANMHPDDAKRLFAVVEQAAAAQDSLSDAFRVGVAPTDERWVSMDAAPQLLADGSVLWHGYLSDVTASKKRELATQELAQRLDLAADSAGVGVWELRIPDNVLIWDERMHQVYGTDPDSFRVPTKAGRSWCIQKIYLLLKVNLEICLSMIFRFAQSFGSLIRKRVTSAG